MNNLNDEQIQAIESNENVLLIACPGSGKTHTLIHKVARELSKIDSHRKFVIAITYTNNAADEIRSRIENLNIDTSQLWVGTIHSFCLEWIIRPYSIFIESVPNDFIVLNEYARFKAAKEIFSGCKENQVREILKEIDLYRKEVYKNRIFGEVYQPQTYNLDVNRIYNVYTEKIRKWRMLDFQMILEYSYSLLLNNRFVSRNLQNIFSFIAVDEYQDTQALQYLILSLIVDGSKDINLFIVGDPNQAIYGSLGGIAMSRDSLESLMRIKFREFNLSKNYRSSSVLVDYSKGYMVQPMAMTASGELSMHKSRIFALDGRNSGVNTENIGSYISDIIKYNIYDLGIKPSEICVLAPWWLHVSSITRKLNNELENINFDGPGLSPFKGNDTGFWYLMSKIALTEPSVETYSKRMFWASDGLKILNEELNITENILMPSDILRISNRIKSSLDKRYDDDCSTENYLNEFFDMFMDIMAFPLARASSIVRSRDIFFIGYRSRVEYCLDKDNVNIDRLGFCRGIFSGEKGVKISTIHAVKGQEYDSVILVSMLDDYIPHSSVPLGEREEEAKKILYVASTRARKNLWMIAESLVERNGVDVTKRLICDYVSQNNKINIFEIDLGIES